MQIVSNTTAMGARLTVVVDKDGRDHCVVVVKGTFTAGPKGALTLAEAQRPLALVDEPYGEPATTCTRYESDFALTKPRTDVLVVGKAVAPGGKPTSRLMVRLEVEGSAKDILVIGDRRWMSGLGKVVPSSPAPFTEMPLTYERAFGGSDDSRGPEKLEVERRNPLGVGFHPHRASRQVVGLPLPNLERPDALIGSMRDRPEPIGLGCVGRSWKPRIDYAGTYDQRWLEEVAPFLPADFDDRYYQCAPVDQQFPRFKGHELIRCGHMAEEPVVEFRMPSLDVPVSFGFVDRVEERRGVLDTVILEPHLKLAMLVWRVSVPLGKKLNALRAIRVGEVPRRPAPPKRDPRSGKPRFEGLEATIQWLRARKQKAGGGAS